MKTLKTIYICLLSVYLGCFSSSSFALALSKAEIKSYLNQVLDVRIDLIADNDSELDNLEVELSQIFNLNVNQYQLKHEIVRGPNGAYLKISTTDVVREPVIEFTLEIGWSEGHVVREYAFLIDPPKN